jgi:molybdate transport system regulatory protein
LANYPSLRIRIDLGPDTALGPGKADLLEAIRETGSIAAAGRRLGMSYKRAWYLIDTMNDHFNAPLVVSTKGGKAGGGAHLTKLGEDVLAAYRRVGAAAARAVAADLAALQRIARKKPAARPRR